MKFSSLVGYSDQEVSPRNVERQATLPQWIEFMFILLYVHDVTILVKKDE